MTSGIYLSSPVSPAVAVGRSQQLRYQLETYLVESLRAEYEPGYSLWVLGSAA